MDGIWDEGLMVEVVPVPGRRTGARRLGGAVRAEVSARNLVRAAGVAHELTRGQVPAVVYGAEGRRHGNFLDASYRRILADAGWSRRLKKAHTGRGKGRDWRELDTAVSSDALLMNVFCYPGVFGPGLCSLLGVERGCRPEFGVKPRVPLVGGRRDCSEVDMRVGGLLVEAKLTESGFGRAAVRMVERYVGFDEVFERDGVVRDGVVEEYQLVRGVMAAWAFGERYCLICDGRRGDLLEAWGRVVGAVRGCEVRGRLGVVTWQEIAGRLPGVVRGFLGEKYGIFAG